MLYCYNNQTVLGLKALQHPQHAGARVVYSSNLRNIVGLNSILRISSSLAKILIVSCCLRSHTWTNTGFFFWRLRDQIRLKLTINHTFPGVAASSRQLQVAGFCLLPKSCATTSISNVIVRALPAQNKHQSMSAEEMHSIICERLTLNNLSA